MCDKKSFSTKLGADKRANLIYFKNRGFGQILRSYLCADCGSYHLTHKLDIENRNQKSYSI